MIGAKSITDTSALNVGRLWPTVVPLGMLMKSMNRLEISRIMTATDAQIKYIECLAIDLGLDRHRRNAHVADAVGGPVSFLDQLTVAEASKAITYLKALKDGEE